MRSIARRGIRRAAAGVCRACRMPCAMSRRRRVPVVGLVPSMGCKATCIGAGMPGGAGYEGCRTARAYERLPDGTGYEGLPGGTGYEGCRAARDMRGAGHHVQELNFRNPCRLIGG